MQADLPGATEEDPNTVGRRAGCRRPRLITATAAASLSLHPVALAAAVASLAAAGRPGGFVVVTAAVAAAPAVTTAASAATVVARPPRSSSLTTSADRRGISNGPPPYDGSSDDGGSEDGESGSAGWTPSTAGVVDADESSSDFAEALSAPYTATRRRGASSSVASAAVAPHHRHRHESHREEDDEPDLPETGSSSQPLRTLKKLQAMLDDTDYATAASPPDPSSSPRTSASGAEDPDGGRTGEHSSAAITAAAAAVSRPSAHDVHRSGTYEDAGGEGGGDDEHPAEKLWTSKDRSKYRRQQRRMREERHRREAEERQKRDELEGQRRRWREQEMQEAQTSQYEIDENNDMKNSDVDDEEEEDGEGADGTTDDTDDGMGYTLPNLPVYFSDTEGASEEFDMDTEVEAGVERGVGEESQQQQRSGGTGPSPQHPQHLVQRSQQKQSQQDPAQLLSHQHHQHQQHQHLPSPFGYSAGPDPYVQQQQSYSHYGLPGGYPPPPPLPQQQPPQPQQQHYPPNLPQHLQQYYQQQQQYAAQYAAWAMAQYAQAQQQNQGSAGQQSGGQGRGAYGPFPPPHPFMLSGAYPGFSQQQPSQQQQQLPLGQRFGPQPFATLPPPRGGPIGSQQPQAARMAQGAAVPATGRAGAMKARMEGSTAGTSAATAKISSPSLGTNGLNTAGHTQDARGQRQQQQQSPPPAVVLSSVPQMGPPQAMMTSNPYEIALAPEQAHPVSLAEAGTMITFDSLQKISLVIIGACLLCYCAVSPRTLPVVDYNMHFKENVRIVSLSVIAPVLTFLSVFDAAQNDVNSVVNTFYTSFTAGFVGCFVLEVLVTTALRLAVFALWEPAIFDLTPEVPTVVLPWVLRERRYRPKRITLFVADFATSCVASPIVEEWVKLKIVQLCVRLPRNFRRCKRNVDGKKGKKKKRNKPRLEAIPRSPGEQDATNINSYVTQMLAASLGLKLCDATRRVLMYTKRTDADKAFYAFFRGVLPIHELCGTMTALELAKRDVLGVEMPLWRMLLPSVFIHGLANFKGLKPIFKWNSSTPWSELQLSPWNAVDDSTLSQIVSKGFAKFMWLVILGRVLGYCIKNYYLIGRRAVKRTTTYAGKRSAFSAELVAHDELKKKKKDKQDSKHDKH